MKRILVYGPIVEALLLAKSFLRSGHKVIIAVEHGEEPLASREMSLFRHSLNIYPGMYSLVGVPKKISEHSHWTSWVSNDSLDAVCAIPNCGLFEDRQSRYWGKKAYKLLKSGAGSLYNFLTQSMSKLRENGRILFALWPGIHLGLQRNQKHMLENLAGQGLFQDKNFVIVPIELIEHLEFESFDEAINAKMPGLNAKFQVIH